MMTVKQVKNRLQILNLNYQNVDKEVAECQNKLARLAERKVYLEGAYNELKVIYDELVKEEESSETETEQPDRNPSDTDEKK